MTAARPLVSDYQAVTVSALRLLGGSDASGLAQALQTSVSTVQCYLSKCRGRGLITRYWDRECRTFIYHLPIPQQRFLLTVQGTNSPVSAAHCSDLVLAAQQAGIPARMALDLASAAWAGGSAHAGVYGIEWKGVA